MTGETHLINDTMYACHTSCDLLNAGTFQSILEEVAAWVEDHPYDVVTILLGNGNYSKPELYAPYIESTGITQYTYTPEFVPMTLDDWPTLESMILHGQRVVMFLDYEADYKTVPYLLDEFSQMWETSILKICAGSAEFILSCRAKSARAHGPTRIRPA